MELVAVVGCAAVAMVLLRGSTQRWTEVEIRRWRFGAVSSIVIGALVVMSYSGADAAVAAPVGLGTAGQFSVLGASTVTNTGNSTLNDDLGVFPGSAITGFPPGLVVPPSVTHTADAVAQQGQSDLDVAYVDAANRSVDGTTSSDLTNLILLPGVYSGPGHSPLGLSGRLTLGGGGDPSAVFVFQTDSTLITGSGSSVVLTNGAQECNVFWQVGSSATLGTGSSFAGSILANTSITVTTGVVVHGRALAQNGAVTLDSDTFVAPTCARAPTGTTTTVPPATSTDVATTIAAIPTTGPIATTDATNPATTIDGATTTLVVVSTVEGATTTLEALSTTIAPTTAPTIPETSSPETTMPQTSVPDTTMPASSIAGTTTTTTVVNSAAAVTSTTLGASGSVPTSTVAVLAIPRPTTPEPMVSGNSLLPATGATIMTSLANGLVLLGFGLLAVRIARRRPPTARG